MSDIIHSSFMWIVVLRPLVFVFESPQAKSEVLYPYSKLETLLVVLISKALPINKNGARMSCHLSPGISACQETLA